MRRFFFGGNVIENNIWQQATLADSDKKDGCT
jgi:hypothetical protein